MPYEPLDPVDLGGGAYAVFDGTFIWITAETTTTPPLINMDAPAILNLMRYAKRCWGSPPTKQENETCPGHPKVPRPTGPEDL